MNILPPPTTADERALAQAAAWMISLTDTRRCACDLDGLMPRFRAWLRVSADHRPAFQEVREIWSAFAEFAGDQVTETVSKRSTLNETRH